MNSQKRFYSFNIRFLTRFLSLCGKIFYQLSMYINASDVIHSLRYRSVLFTRNVMDLCKLLRSKVRWNITIHYNFGVVLEVFFFLNRFSFAFFFLIKKKFQSNFNKHVDTCNCFFDFTEFKIRYKLMYVLGVHLRKPHPGLRSLYSKIDRPGSNEVNKLMNWS